MKKSGCFSKNISNLDTSQSLDVKKLYAQNATLSGNFTTSGDLYVEGKIGVSTEAPSKLSLKSGSGGGIYFEPGTTSNGINDGFHNIGFNGYNNGSEVVVNAGKNRWRMIVDQRSATDELYFDTWDGSSGAALFKLLSSRNVEIGNSSTGNSTTLYGTLISIPPASSVDPTNDGEITGPFISGTDLIWKSKVAGTVYTHTVTGV